jgi:hypothetical protein
MTPGGDDEGRFAGGPAGEPATVTPPAGAVCFGSTGGVGFGADCAGFGVCCAGFGVGWAALVERFGAGLDATRRAGRGRSFDAVESPEPAERRELASAPTAAGSDVEGGVRAAVVAGDGGRVGAGFGPDRHADTSNMLATTTSP